VVLKETVSDDIRRPFEWRRANPFGAVRQLRKLPGLGPLLLVFFFYQVAFMVYPSIWAFFGKERFGWEPSMIGLSLALFGIMLAIVQGGLIRPVMRLLGERGTVIYGHVFDIFGFLALAFVTSGTVALILTPLAALAAVITPALQGIMSRTVGPDQQGELQGALVSVTALAMIVAPMVMTGVFSAFTRADAPVYMPGAPFLLSAGLIAIGLGIFIRNRRRKDADTGLS
jgi:DHA1 family tetracycline resistance protein-like MFS transporter